MFGSNRNSGIRAMHGYNDALRWFNNTLPIRGNGRNAGIRPLGHRDRPQFRITLDEATQVVSCFCYQTPVVAYHPDNTVHIKTGGFNTQTTAAFISDVLGVSTSVRDNSLVVHLRGGTYRTGGELVLSVEPYEYKVMSGVTPDVVHKIDRKAMKEVRNKASGFINYARGMLKVCEGRFNAVEVADLSTQIRNTTPDSHWQLGVGFIWRDSVQHVKQKHVEFMQLVESNDVENWHRALLWLVGSSPPRYRTDFLYANEVDVMYKLTEAQIIVYPNILVESEVPLGTISIDRYKKFTPFKELA